MEAIKTERKTRPTIETYAKNDSPNHSSWVYRKYSANEICAHTNAPVQKRRIQQVLRQFRFLNWEKAALGPNLTKRHCEKRVEWAEKYARDPKHAWTNVIFTEEKRFNIDGPDGLRSYWHDNRVEPRYFSRCQNGEGYVMVWGAFSYRGTIRLVILSANLNAEMYVHLLASRFLPKADQIYPE